MRRWQCALHAEAAQSLALAQHDLLGNDRQSVALEEWARRQTGLGKDALGAGAAEVRARRTEECGRHTPARMLRRREQQIDVTLMRVADETGHLIAVAREPGMQTRQAGAPDVRIGRQRCPGATLFAGIGTTRKIVNRRGKHRHQRIEVGFKRFTYPHFK